MYVYWNSPNQNFQVAALGSAQPFMAIGKYSGFLYNRGELINVVMEEKFEILIVVMEIVLIIVVMANSVHHDYTVHITR